MRKRLTFFLFIWSSFAAGITLAQDTALDSLKTKVAAERNDSLKAVLLNDLSWELKFRDLKESEKYCLEGIEVCTKANLLKLRSSFYNTLGLVKNESNDFERGIYYLELSLKDKALVGDKKGSATVKNNMGVAYKNSGEPEKARSFYDEALATHVELGNVRGQAETYQNLGVLAREQGELEKADAHFLKALELRQKINDKNGIAAVYNNLSANSSDRNDFKRSLEYLYLAAKIFEETTNKTALVTIYANIAKLNKDLLNDREAMDYCKKAIDLGIATGAYQNSTSAYAVLGDLYFGQDKIQQSFAAYSKGLSLLKANTGGVYESDFHLGKAACYMAEKKHDKALPELTAAIRIARERKMDKPLARALQKLADLYLATNVPGSVKQPLDEAIRIAKANNYSDLLELCYKTYARFHDQEKSAEISNDYLLKANQIHDTVFTADLAQRFAEMQTKYETEKKETEIKLLKQQEQIKNLQLDAQQSAIKKQRYVLIALAVCLLMALLIGYVYIGNYKLKARMKEEALVRIAEEQERQRIAKDIHDELGSGLSKIIFLTELLNKQPGEKQLAGPVASISATARQLIENMRDLLRVINPDNATLANLVASIREYSYDYLEEFPLELTTEFPDEISDRKISHEAGRHVYMIVKESLQNIAKHANAGKVALRLTLTDVLLISIKDNGSGFDINTIEKSNGLKNLSMRGNAVGGTMQISSRKGEGTKICFSVPLKNILK